MRERTLLALTAALLLTVPTAAHANPAKGWVTGQKPVAADGFSVTAFATGLDQPEQILALPNGDILVQHTGAGRYTILRDADRDGIAEMREEFSPSASAAPGTTLNRAFYKGTLFPQRYSNGAFIGQHGAARVIFVPFQDGLPAGKPETILTGFHNEKGEALGRPVGVTVDGNGAILVADDIGDTIWRITPDA